MFLVQLHLIYRLTPSEGFSREEESETFMTTSISYFKDYVYIIITFTSGLALFLARASPAPM